MVDVLGHLGMALIWLSPAWFILDDEKTAALFVGVGFWFGMLPDVDLVLKTILPTVKHHGVFHTLLAALVFAAVLGPIIGWVLKKALGDSDWLSPKATETPYRFGFVMILVAATSHVFADMLSAPDISEAVEPLWPVVQGSVGIDVVWYNNPYVNWGLFLGGLVLNVAFWAWVRRSDTRSRATNT